MLLQVIAKVPSIFFAAWAFSAVNPKEVVRSAAAIKPVASGHFVCASSLPNFSKMIRH
jgi:hypothetical protein